MSPGSIACVLVGLHTQAKQSDSWKRWLLVACNACLLCSTLRSTFKSAVNGLRSYYGAVMYCKRCLVTYAQYTCDVTRACISQDVS